MEKISLLLKECLVDKTKCFKAFKNSQASLLQIEKERCLSCNFGKKKKKLSPTFLCHFIKHPSRRRNKIKTEKGHQLQENVNQLSAY